MFFVRKFVLVGVAALAMTLGSVVTSVSEQVVPNPDTDSPAEVELWGALAAGIQSGRRSRVSIGSALRYSSKEEAQSRALARCQENGVSCSVISTFTGCGYITVSTNGSQNVAWGAGPTAQDAYNECYKRVKGGNCVTQTIGGCNR